MFEISLTKFLDFVHKAGTPRVTCLRNIKKQYEAGYTVGGDYYRILREKVIDVFKNDKAYPELEEVLHAVVKEDKVRNYKQCVVGIKKFLSKHEIKWCGVSKGEWKHKDLSIIVNPELGLQIDGNKYAVKLYFKVDEVTKARSECIFYMIEAALGKAGKGYIPAILDCRTGTLIQKTKDVPAVKVLLQSEAEAFLMMWSMI